MFIRFLFLIALLFPGYLMAKPTVVAVNAPICKTKAQVQQITDALFSNNQGVVKNLTGNGTCTFTTKVHLATSASDVSTDRRGVKIGKVALKLGGKTLQKYALLNTNPELKKMFGKTLPSSEVLKTATTPVSHDANTLPKYAPMCHNKKQLDLLIQYALDNDQNGIKRLTQVNKFCVFSKKDLKIWKISDVNVDLRGIKTGKVKVEQGNLLKQMYALLNPMSEFEEIKKKYQSSKKKR